MNAVYREYDQQALDAEYNLRPIWPDVPEAIAHRETESARVRGRIPGRLNIAYGETPKESLDVFPPSNGRGDAPALIYIHGGYWQELIETLVWAHERTPLANLIRWRDKPVALSIVQARLVGLVHFSVGYILTYASFVIASTSGKFA